MDVCSPWPAALSGTWKQPNNRMAKLYLLVNVSILKGIRHENLVTLIGACSEEFALFYEYLPNGTLRKRLVDGTLSWKEIVQVALSICSGLQFLHDAPNSVVHGDLKPKNILFDSRNVCKIGDFELFPNLIPRSDTTTPGHSIVPKGTVSYYMDPQFTLDGKLATKSNVYALGIILLDLATGRLPLNMRALYESNLSQQLVNQRLDLGDRGREQAVAMRRVGLGCSNNDRRRRPELETEVGFMV